MINESKYWDYLRAEVQVLRPGQLQWLVRLCRTITRMYRDQKSLAHEHCVKIGLPIVLYEREGSIEDYTQALHDWVAVLQRKNLLARLGKI